MAYAGMTKAQLILALANVADDSVVYLRSNYDAIDADGSDLVVIDHVSISDDETTDDCDAPQFAVLEVWTSKEGEPDAD